MAFVTRGQQQTAIKDNVKSFKERAAVLQAEAKHFQEHQKQCEQGVKQQRGREIRAKQEMQRVRDRMQVIDEKMEKNSHKLTILTDRLYQARRRNQDNLDTSKFLQHSHVDLEGKLKDIHQALQYGALMRQKRVEKEKGIKILEQKIDVFERRIIKADDRGFLIKEKLATHKHLQGNPEISENEVYTGHDDMDRRANHLRHKINHAVTRARKSEKRAENLENRADVLEISLENYERRNRDFQQSKRELMSSKMF